MARAVTLRRDIPVEGVADSADLQIRLGDGLERAGDLDGAVQCYRRALFLDPTSYASYNNLGNIFASLDDRATALLFFKAAADINPDVAEIHNNLGNIHLRDEHIEEAIASYRTAIALQPETASYWNHLGNALRSAENYSEAEVLIRRAIALRPDYAEAYVNLGFLFFEQQRFAEAEQCYRRAIETKPDFAQAHTCLGWMLLRRGEFREGWAEQEWRWRWKDFPSPKRSFQKPQWRGEEATGVRIFLHAEQGFGDTIQFLRYVPLVARLGATIILEVHPELVRLARWIGGGAYVIARGDAIPEFDFHCPLMSLPLAFSTDPQRIPGDVPYFRSELLQRQEEAQLQKLRVGLVWAGDARSRIDRRRSLSLDLLASWFAVEGVAIYSLQRGGLGEQDGRSAFAGWLAESGDFADTAVSMSELDLIVTVDTAVAHLAGALGLPVWILLPRVADWRWLTDREDSPWYPSARLFRQEIAGEWEPVAARVRQELSLAAARYREEPPVGRGGSTA